MDDSFNILKGKKGNVLLAVVASSVVATTIVATHQMTQSFSHGATQKFNRHQALYRGQNALALAGLLAKKNIVTCSTLHFAKRACAKFYRGDPFNDRSHPCYDFRVGHGDTRTIRKQCAEMRNADKINTCITNRVEICTELFTDIEGKCRKVAFNEEGNYFMDPDDSGSYPVIGCQASNPYGRTDSAAFLSNPYFSKAKAVKDLLTEEMGLQNGFDHFFTGYEEGYKGGEDARAQTDGSGQKVFFPKKENTWEVDKLNPLHGAEIKWSASSWANKETGFAFSSEIMNQGYFCQKENSYEIIDGQCDPPTGNFDPDLLSAVNIQNSPSKQCKNASGSHIPNSVCNYFGLNDSDHYMVFITVKIPYYEVSGDSSNEESSKKYLVLRGAVRRSPAVVKFYQKETVQCAPKCETAIYNSNNIPASPMCVGLSDDTTEPALEEGEAKIFSPIGYRRGQVARVPIVIKNFGPGIIYSADLRREDLNKDSDTLLSQVGFTPHVGPSIFDDHDEENIKQGTGRLPPGQSVTVYDYVPCYAENSYFRSNSEKINCTCNVRDGATLTQADIDEALKDCRNTLSELDDVVDSDLPDKASERTVRSIETADLTSGKKVYPRDSTFLDVKGGASAPKTARLITCKPTGRAVYEAAKKLHAPPAEEGFWDDFQDNMNQKNLWTNTR